MPSRSLRSSRSSLGPAALGLLALPALLALSAPAGAHIGEPTAKRVFALDDGQQWLLDTSFGVIESGQPRRFSCEEAFLGGDTFSVAPLSTNQWVTFGHTSIRRTTDGCDFDTVMALSRPPTDVDVRPTSGQVAFVTNGPAEGGIWYSADAGASFASIPFDTATIQLTALRFVDADRLVVSGYDRTQGGAAYMGLVDLETSGVEALAIPDGLTYPSVLAAAAQPAPGGSIVWLGREQGLQVYWGTTEDPASRALPTESWPTGAALSDDGTTAWIAGLAAGAGVTVGSIDPAVGTSATVSWELLHHQTAIGCVGQAAGRVYVCSGWRSAGFDLFELTADGGLEGIAAFDALEGARECPEGSDVAEICPLVWEELAPQLGDASPAPDAGPDAGPDASPDSGAGGEPDGGPETGRGADTADVGGCATAGGPKQRPNGGPTGWIGAAVVGLLGLLSMGRRRQERR